MPRQYEHVRDSERRKLLREGMSEEAATKKAKSIAAATWNKYHPDDPIGAHREPRGERGSGGKKRK